MKQIEVQIPLKQELGRSYLAVRTELVHVHRSFGFLKDKQLSFSTLIPNTPEEALAVFKKIAEENLKRGKAFQLE